MTENPLPDQVAGRLANAAAVELIDSLRGLLAVDAAAIARRGAGGTTDLVGAAPPTLRTALEAVVASGAPSWQDGLAAVPIRVDGTTGAFGVAFSPTAPIGEREKRYLSAVAHLAAEAVDRAGEAERERVVREAAEAAVVRLRRLQTITTGLSHAVDADEVAEVVVDEGLAALGASAGSLCLVSDDGTSIELVRSVGYRPDVEDQWKKFPIDSPVPASEALRSGRIITISSVSERDERWPIFKGTATANKAFAVVPLGTESTTQGVVSLSFAEERTFTGADFTFLEALAYHCSLALDRARLYEAERQAHAAAAQAMDRLAFVAEASELLASSLDVGTTLARMVRLVVPELADSCAVHLRRDGHLEPVAMANADPDREATMWAVARQESELHDTVLTEVAATGVPLVANDVEYSVVEQIARDDEHRDLLRVLAVRSAAVVPLRARGRTVGVLSVSMTDSSDRTFAPADIALVTELARRAAIAVDNALLYRERSEIAQTLQASLLPKRPPSIPGLDVAARFVAGADGTVVGGDFYDVFEAGDGRWWAVVGDVCGRGVDAAALTALVRHTITATAALRPDPAAVLSHVNRALLAESTGERFCTVVLAALAVDGAGALVELATAGHPAPYVLRAGGAIERVEAKGTLLGALPEARPGVVELRLADGDAIVLYTDGVTEAREDGEGAGVVMFGEPGLCRVLGTVAGQPAAAIARQIEDAVTDFAGRMSDDLAILVMRAAHVEG